MLISSPKRAEIYFKSIGKENLKFEKKSGNRRKRHQLKRNAKASNFYPKIWCCHYHRALKKLIKEIHYGDFKVKVSNLTLKIKMLSEEVDIYTCS